MNHDGKQAMRRVRHRISFSVILLVLLFVCAASGVGWVYAGMLAQERWPIKWMQVDGPFERVSAEQLRAHLEPMAGGSFFTVDTKGMQDAALNISWISDVVVQKTWPDSITVSVREYMPVAHWVDGHLIAADGSAFVVPFADDIQGLPWLDSPIAQRETVFTSWKKFDDLLVVIGQQVETLSVDARGSWSAELSGGTTVKFGKGDVFKGLNTLISSWNGLMQDKSLPPVSIDLRYTNGFAVLWPENIETIAGNYGEES